MVSKADYVELGLTCASVCEALTRGLDGRQTDQFSQSALEAIEKLTTWVEPVMRAPGDFLTEPSFRSVTEIQGQIIKRGKRNAISRRYHRKDDKEAIATWRLDLDRILHVFDVRSVTSVRWLLISRVQTRLVGNPHSTVSDTRHDIANVHTTVSDTHHDTPDTDNIVPDVRHDVSNSRPVVSKVRSDVANPHTTASDIYRDKLKGREGVGGQSQAVSVAHDPTVIKQSLTTA